MTTSIGLIVIGIKTGLLLFVGLIIFRALIVLATLPLIYIQSNYGVFLY